jgi:hypothetical protein
MAKLLGKGTPADLHRQAAASRRYLAALKTYAQIRAIEGRSSR